MAKIKYFIFQLSLMIITIFFSYGELPSIWSSLFADGCTHHYFITEFIQFIIVGDFVPTNL